MIFATMGTSVPFPRLLKRLDELAEETKMEIVVQTGTTPQTARHCRMFDYAPTLKEYIAEASMVISHAGLGLPMELLQMKKSFVLVPRLARFGEHTNDHQLEIAEMLHSKFGIIYFPNTDDLTPALLKDPPPPYPFSYENLERFRKNILPVISGGC